MKILFITNNPSPYRVDFFNEFGKRCDLTVTFEETPDEQMNRDKKWFHTEYSNFKAVFLKRIKLGKHHNPLAYEILKYINMDFDYIIVGMYATLTASLAIMYMKVRGIPYIIEADGGMAKSGKGIKEQFKRFLLSSAKAWFSSGEETDRYLITYGAKKERIFRYPFTSLRKNDVLEELPKQEIIRNSREVIGAERKYVIISIGQFIYRKGFHTLIEAAYRMKNKDCDIYIIGGKPTREYINSIREYQINNIYFIDFMTKEKLEDYFNAADLFVLPTREDIWGLVINEAMAHGLPVITTKRCVAGLEMIKEDQDKCIVDIDDPIELAIHIDNMLDDDELRKKLALKNLKTASEYTIENMSKVHYECINILRG